VTHARDPYGDVAFYELLHGTYRDDVAFYRSLALDHPGRLLEIGAGTGRLTREFARLAEAVVALEPADAMRFALQEALTEEAWEGATRVEVRGDTIEAYAQAEPEATCDLVLAPFNVLLHAATLETQDAFLQAAHRCTAPGGLFAFDVIAPPVGVLEGVPRLELRDDRMDGGEVKVTRVQWHDAVRQVLHNDFEVETLDGEGRVSRRHVELTVRYLHRFELERAVLQAGFSRVQTFEDFGRAPVSASPRHFVVLAYP